MTCKETSSKYQNASWCDCAIGQFDSRLRTHPESNANACTLANMMREIESDEKKC